MHARHGVVANLHRVSANSHRLTAGRPMVAPTFFSQIRTGRFLRPVAADNSCPVLVCVATRVKTARFDTQSVSQRSFGVFCSRIDWYKPNSRGDSPGTGPARYAERIIATEPGGFNSRSNYHPNQSPEMPTGAPGRAVSARLPISTQTIVPHWVWALPRNAKPAGPGRTRGDCKRGEEKMKKISIIFRNPPVDRRGSICSCLYLNHTHKL